jgi:hypothetical protein
LVVDELNYRTTRNFRSECQLDSLTLDVLYVKGLKSRPHGEWDHLEILQCWLTRRKEDERSARVLRTGKQITDVAQGMIRQTAADLKVQQVEEWDDEL